MPDPPDPPGATPLQVHLKKVYPRGVPPAVAEFFDRVAAEGAAGLTTAELAAAVAERGTVHEHTFRDDLIDVVQFARHVLISSLIFVVIAVPAVLLDLAIKGLQKQGLAGPELTQALTAIKYTLLTADTLLFFYRLANHGWKYVKSHSWA